MKGERVKRLFRFPVAALALGALIAVWAAAASAGPGDFINPRKLSSPPPSGAFDFRDLDYGHTITECPQAGLEGDPLHPQPLDRREKDKAEQLSQTGDDKRANTDYSCFPQNETSIAINPVNQKNYLSSQNDYRTLSRQGFNASTNNGQSWYSAELPPLSTPNADVLDASGDPVSVFDRAGVAYEASINFNRTDDENGITVQRSTNGGFTWTRPCVPIVRNPAMPDQGAVCGGTGDPRQPGDGVVTYFDDPDSMFCVVAGPACPPFDDKEWMAAGPRPFTPLTTDDPNARIDPVCFQPVTRTPRVCDPAVVGVDRLYVTWTRFDENPAALFGFTAQIMISFSDDQARSWSPARPISGSAPFCEFSLPADRCDLNQFSVPTVHPRTGLLGVAFENFNTEDENQYLFVRSRDGGVTFEGPFFITPVFDVNYPRSGASGGRPDCTPRGQQNGRAVLQNSCFRVNSGGNVVVDKRDGAFSDDFYLTMSDNRNGTRASSNTDVFFFKSTDGGMTWIGPSRVNNDPSTPPANRDCSPTTGTPPTPNPACAPTAVFGNDQWFPWMDVDNKGVLAFGYHDRRLDTASTLSEWPTSRQRPGNYLAWFWGAGCRITTTATVTATTTTIPREARECLSPGAAVIPQPGAEGQNPGADPVPGQGPTFLGPFENQVISDIAHNLDYSFRAGIFMGDYNAVAFPNVPEGVPSTNQAVAFWTDSRNGRGSGGGVSAQPGRNPACEQADVFFDDFNPLTSNKGESATQGWEVFQVTPCPADALGKRDRNTGSGG